MNTEKPQDLVIYFDLATARLGGLPNVYSANGVAVLGTHASTNGKAGIPDTAKLSGRVAFAAAADCYLAANGQLTRQGIDHCRSWGIEQGHAALVAYTLNTSQASTYKDYVPSQKNRELAAA